MEKEKVRKLFNLMVTMIEQLVKTEQLRTSQLNRLGVTLNQLRKEVANEQKNV